MDTQKLVLVGPKPRLIHAEGRWGEPEPSWYVTEYGFMARSRWEQVQDFQTPPRGFEVPKKIASMEEAINSPLGREIKRKLDLNPEKCTIWQMNLLASNGADYIRYCAPFGEPYLVRWSWFDVHVRAPALKCIAWILTKAGYNPEWK
jgi:hypothetical protein